MPFDVLSFKLAGGGTGNETGNLNRKTVEYKLLCEDPTGQEVWNWLTALNVTTVPGGLPPDGVQDPTDRLMKTGAGPAIPTTYQGLPLDNIEYNQEKRDCNPVLFIVKATWEFSGGSSNSNNSVSQPTGQSSVSVSLDTTADNSTIYQPIQRLKMYPSDQFAVPFATQPGINVQRDGTVKGVKPPSPRQVINFSWTDDNAFFDRAYLRKLNYLAGTVNNAAWPSVWPAADRFKAGEVRFMGANGNVEVDTTGVNSTLQLKFGVIENRVGDALDGLNTEAQLFGGGTEPGGITYQGWDVFWILWDEIEDTGIPGRVKQIPLAGYVDQIFYDNDLNRVFLAGGA